MQELSKKKFEEEYSKWISFAAKDIAFSLSRLKPDDLKKIIIRNEQYLEKPESITSTSGLYYILTFRVSWVTKFEIVEKSIQ
jgi:hypothetical protein